MKSKTKTKQIKQPTTCKQMLKLLRKFMKTAPTEEARGLWDVLTALRGPDGVDSYQLKGFTTQVIRHKVFGIDSPVAMFANISEDSAENAAFRCGLSRSTKCFQIPHFNNGHFRTHARKAFDALGLYWHQDNSKGK